VEKATAVKIRSVFQLLRLPNVFTAMADVLAGYLIVSSGRFQGAALIGVLVTTSCLYSLGCALNDLMDREVDRIERPTRPIPSQTVTIIEAVVISFVLAVVGLFAAMAAGPNALTVACLLIIVVVIYDTLAKAHRLWGPFTMAMCRALNLVLGMSVDLENIGPFWPLPLLTLAYVFSLTVLSRLEVGRRESGYKIHLVLGWVVFMTGVFVLLIVGVLKPVSVVYLGILLVTAGPPVFEALKSYRPEAVQRAVKVLILGIPVVDALYVSGAHGLALSMVVIACILPSIYFAKRFYVT